MTTEDFDNKVRSYIFNPHLISNVDLYKPGDPAWFRDFGNHLLAINTNKIYLLLVHIDKILKDPIDTINWLMKQFGICTDITNCELQSLARLNNNIHDYLMTDLDEETGDYWLFDNSEEASDFLSKCEQVIKYSDLFLIAQKYNFDIINTADFFAGVVFDDPIFYIDNCDAFKIDEIKSKYYRSIYAAVVYFWANSIGVIPSLDYIKNENRDNYKTK